MEAPLHIDYAEANNNGIYQVTITDSKGEKEILHHILPDYNKLNLMLLKGIISSFEVELDYS